MFSSRINPSAELQKHYDYNLRQQEEKRQAEATKRMTESLRNINGGGTGAGGTSGSGSGGTGNSGIDLTSTKELWNVAYDQRQREAETNAERAFRYRGQENIRDFGQTKELSKQGFEQDRTLRSDELSSIERREAAQAQARERLASVNQQLKQRQQESERGAAMAAFSNNRR